jgi:predicted DNA binding protein
MPQGVETDLQTLRHRFDVRPNLAKAQSLPIKKQRHADIAEAPLTRGQMNAVRAAFKAGITPTRIARQFGISQSSVRKALASDEPNG